MSSSDPQSVDIAGDAFEAGQIILIIIWHKRSRLIDKRGYLRLISRLPLDTRQEIW